MKRLPKTKIAQALASDSQIQVNLITPKRLVSSLQQILHQSISGQPFAKAMLYGAMGILPLTLLSTVTQATELEIYEQNSPTLTGGGGPVITMMLDNSAVMGGPLTVQRGGRAILPTFLAPGQTYHALGINSLHKDYAGAYPECAETPSNVAVSSPTPENVNNKIYPSIHNYRRIGFTATIKQTSDDKEISFELEACPLNAQDSQGHTQYKYTRLGRLKLGMVSLLADSVVINDGSNRELPVYKDIINGGFRVGLGQYPTPLGEAQSGNIVVPAGRLTVPHRIELVEKIVETKPLGLIPVAHAYAEAGAYMLGTKTATIETGERYIHIGSAYYTHSRWEYDRCVGLQNSARDNARINGELVSVYLCTQGSANAAPSTEEELSSLSDLIVTNSQVNSAILNNISGTPRKIYFKKITSWPSNNYSGMTASSADTKNSDGTRYISPITDGQECSANGIYFLSNGYPLDVFQSTAYSDRRLSALYPMNESLEDVLKNNTSEQVTTPSCNSGLEDENSGPVDDGSVRGWTCIGEYAQKLNNSQLKKGALRTAFIGFGTEFRGISDANCEAAPNLNAKNACKFGSDAKNADGSYKYNYGQGGFYHVETPEEIANSFISFANKLKGDYTPQPGEGPSVAIDPTNSTDTRNFAYLPMMLPKPGEPNLIWEGNLKKYKIKDGTLYGADDKHVYDSVNGQLKKDSANLWQKDDSTIVADGDNIHTNGVYAKLFAPYKEGSVDKSDTVRKVFVEKQGGTKKDVAGSILTQIKVVNNKPVNIAFIKDDAGNDTTDSVLGYNLQRQHYLLNFLGYKEVPVFMENDSGQTVPITTEAYSATGEYNGKTQPTNNISTYTPTAQDSTIKILGGINNSKPQEILYEYTKTPSATAGAAPIITESYKVLYGSMDGALHLVDAKTGVEDFAFIPNVIMNDDHQVAALKEGSTQTADGRANSASNVSFGVDAPWHVRTNYSRSYDTGTGTTTVTAKGANNSFIKAYGGLGRGGKGFYGLDITNSNAPKFLFHIEPQGQFSRLGRTWSKPVETKVRYKDGADLKSKDVLIFSGGYDICYDIPEFVLGSTNTDLIKKIQDAGMQNQCLDGSSTKSQAEGNAVYMIDADNGSLIWSTSQANTTSSSHIYTPNKNLKHSVAGEVSVIYADDSNQFVDAIYFADLGGQVFRADFDDAKGYNEKDADGASVWAKRVIRILDTNRTQESDTVTKPALRFFQRPVVSLYRIDNNNKPVERGGKLIELVTVASGDRSNPLSKLSDRQHDQTPNKVISVWDTDITNNKWPNLEESDITLKNSSPLATGEGEGVLISQLTNIWANNTGITEAQKSELRSGTKKGWFDNLVRFSGESSEGTDIIKSVDTKDTNTDAVGNNINYLKSISQPTLRASRLFVPVYNRMAYIPAKNACTPVPTGVSEAQEYCLPFGVCTTSTKNADGVEVLANSRGHTYVLGSGIGSVTIASGQGSNRAQVLTAEKAIETNNGSGTDGGAGTLERIKDAFYSLYKLLPNEWFERSSND